MTISSAPLPPSTSPDAARSRPGPTHEDVDARDAVAWRAGAGAGADVVVDGVSMQRLVAVCGSPCVHSADPTDARVPVGWAESPLPVGSSARSTAERPACSLVVVTVTAVLADREVGRIVCVDAHLDGVVARWDEVQLLGRASASTAPAQVMAGCPAAGSQSIALPADLAVGDLLVVPCEGQVTVHDVRLGARPVATGSADVSRSSSGRRLPARRRRWY